MRRLIITLLLTLAMTTSALAATIQPGTSIEPKEHLPTKTRTVIDTHVVWGPGLQLVADDIIIADGGYLEIEPGTDVVMTDPVEFLIQAGGKIIAFGSVNDPITFSGYQGQEWDGFHLIGDANSPADTRLHMARVTVQNTSSGAWGYNSYVTMIHCDMQACGVQLQGCHGFVQNTTSTGGTGLGAFTVDAWFHITDCAVDGGSLGVSIMTVSTGTGIISGCSATNGEAGCQAMGNVTVSDSDFYANSYGILLTGYNGDASTVTGCTMNNNTNVGVLALSGDYTSVFSSCDISGNLTNVRLEPATLQTQTVILGDDATGQGGNNRIINPGATHVQNGTSATVKAENCYWGGGPGQLPIIRLKGSVDTYPLLVNDPFAKSAGEAPAVTVECKAYPNPFNPSTTIAFEISDAGAHARLEVFDIRGRLVRSLVDDALDAGRHEITWRGEDSAGQRMASGVYLYSLRIDGRSAASGRLVMNK